MSKDDDRIIRKFIQDLEWVIHSPCLLSGIEFPDPIEIWDRDFLVRYQIRTGFQKVLKNLKNRKKEILEFLRTRETNRLGKYYEILWEFIFREHPDFELLGKGISLRNKELATLGEFDFLIRDLLSLDEIHLEVAIKFYCKLLPGTANESYIGPSFNDRLDIKVKKLESQIGLSQTDLGKELLSKYSSDPSDSIDFRQAILVQGVIYYHRSDTESSPSLSKNHLRGEFLYASEWLAKKDWIPRKYLVLQRLDWLSNPDKGDWKNAISHQSLRGIVEGLGTNQQGSIQIAWKGIFGQVKRVFLVPDSMPQTR
jgi:hypothetical protein